MVFGKLMHLLLLRILQYDVGIRFHISLPSILYTAVLFTFIFFLTWLYNLFQVKLANPVELLRGGNVGEREPRTKRHPGPCRTCRPWGAGYYLADHHGAAHWTRIEHLLSWQAVLVSHRHLLPSSSPAASLS